MAASGFQHVGLPTELIRLGDRFNAESLWRHYGTMAVSGLAQTRAYAKAMLQAAGVTDERWLAHLVDARLAFQELVLLRNPQIHLVIHEAALAVWVGDPNGIVMVEQLGFLLQLSESVVIQVVKSEAGAFRGFFEPYDLIEAGPDRGEAVVMVESTAGHQFTNDAPTLHRYGQMFRAAAEVALSPVVSRDFIRGRRDAYARSISSSL